MDRFGTNHFVIYREVSPLLIIIEKGPLYYGCLSIIGSSTVLQYGN